jgi:hypothetical protein
MLIGHQSKHDIVIITQKSAGGEAERDFTILLHQLPKSLEEPTIPLGHDCLRRQ